MKTPPSTTICLSAIAICFFGMLACNRAGLPDTQLGNWLQAAPIDAYPRSSSVSFTIGDRAYVGLGYNETISQPGRLTDFWTFSVDSGWTQIQSFPGAPRSNAAAFSVGNFGYVGTGWDGVTVFNDFYQYDPAANQWTKK